MADVWLPESEIYLAAVPWDSSYNYVVNFSKKDLIDYIKDGGTGEPAGLSNTGTTYIRPGQPVMVDAPWSQVRKYNFCMVHNPAQPVEGSEEDYRFYFITDSAYASPASTVLSLQVDVWSTYMVFRSNTTYFGLCFYESGHLAFSEVAYRESRGYRTLELARRYAAVDQPLTPTTLFTETVDEINIAPDGYYFVMLSSINLESDFGTVTNPNIQAGIGSVNANTVYGTSMYIFEHELDFINVTLRLQNAPWIAQGVLSVCVVPSSMVGDVTFKDVKIGGVDISVANKASRIEEPQEFVVNGFLQAFNSWCDEFGVPDFMRPFFASSPNFYIELTNFSGSPLILQPEKLHVDYSTGGAPYFVLDARGSISPGSERLYCSPVNYGLPASENEFSYDASLVAAGPDGGKQKISIPQGEYLDVALPFSSVQRVPMVADTSTMYAATHANQIAWQYDNAAWTKSAAKMSAANSLDLARAQMGTNSQNQAIQNQLTDKQQLYSAVGSAISTVGNLASLNIGGALSSAANGVLGYLNTEAAQNASNAQFANNQALLSYTADQNYQLANSIANGNYKNTVAGIAATQRDAEISAPSVAGQYGGSAVNQGLGLNTVFCRVKLPSSFDMGQMYQYFSRYGVEVHEWVTFAPYMLCNMTRFSFHKIPDMSIKNSQANDTELNALKGIFARGVTVVADPTVITDLRFNQNRVRYNGPSYFNSEV